jgi:2-C-methyl-D-erythritol 2,4-cyclodiphosphate synthase
MYRIGQSSDIHELVSGRKLILGGVEIPHEKGLKGHSDADALCHALAESMIGALALGDLGTHFPDTDEKYAGMSSLKILAEVYQMVSNEGYELVNADCLILIERPKMKDYIPFMRENISKALEIKENQINIKATRGEKIGFVGREEGVMAQAVVLLKRR